MIQYVLTENINEHHDIALLELKGLVADLRIEKKPAKTIKILAGFLFYY